VHHFCVIHVTYFVIYLNHMVQEEPFDGKSLALQAGPFAGESVEKHDIHQRKCKNGKKEVSLVA
jgi:hypothetical protein